MYAGMVQNVREELMEPMKLQINRYHCDNNTEESTKEPHIGTHF